MKNQHFRTLILAIPLLILCVACGETQAAAQKAAVEVKAAVAAKPAAAAKSDTATAKPDAPAAKNAPKKPGVPAAAKEEVAEIPPLTVPAGFHYRADGRRDPFVNPVAVKAPSAEPGPAKQIIRPDGLPGVLVSEVRLSGIIRAQDVAMTKAILSVGRKTYFARQGDNLFDGVIKEIRPNEVVFMMKANSTKESSNKEMIVGTGKTSSAALAGEKK